MDGNNRRCWLVMSYKFSGNCVSRLAVCVLKWCVILKLGASRQIIWMQDRSVA